MRTVWKYQLLPSEDLVLRNMLNPHIVYVGMDPAGSGPAVWIDHYTKNPERVLFAPQTVRLRYIGTGHEVPDGMHHVGSTQDGPFMWHVYAQVAPSAVGIWMLSEATERPGDSPDAETLDELAMNFYLYADRQFRNNTTSKTRLWLERRRSAAVEKARSEGQQ